MKKFILLSAVLGLSPLFASAATVFTIIGTVNVILSWVIPLLITLAVVYFIWGVIQYTVSTDEEAKKGARGKIIQGLIGLFIIISFWGIIRIFSQTFGLEKTTGGQLQRNEIPCIPTPSVVC